MLDTDRDRGGQSRVCAERVEHDFDSSVPDGVDRQRGTRIGGGPREGREASLVRKRIPWGQRRSASRRGNPALSPTARARPRSGPRLARIDPPMSVRTCSPVMQRWQYSPPSISAFAVAPRVTAHPLLVGHRIDEPALVVDVLLRYAQSLVATDSKLMVVSTNERIDELLAPTGIADLIGPDNVYRGDERVGSTLRRAHADARAWVETRRARENAQACGRVSLS